MPTPETELKKAIKQYLDLKGILWWWNLQGLASYKGLPDLMALHRGRFYAIEVKTKKGVLSEYQEDFLDKIQDEKGTVIVARSLEDVMEYL